MTKYIFTEKDGDLKNLEGLTIGIIGYGNQGKAQALNLRDSGLKVIIGNREDEYSKRAKKDGFEVYSITEATKSSDIIFLLIPDEIMKDVYENQIQPNLKDKGSIVFASGYNIGFNLIKPSIKYDILLIAPRMIGSGVRERFLSKEGFFSFIHVENDASGRAKEILLALCKGIGTLSKGVIDISFKQEAVLDLFNEQGFGPAFGRVLLNSIYTLVDAGYPPEAVLVEMFMSEEMSYTYKKMAQIGLIKQVEFHSQTSQYGAMSRGIKFVNLPLKKTMKSILENIESGDFAKEWEKKSSRLKFKFLKFFATKTRINRLEQKARKNLNLKSLSYHDVIEPKIDQKVTEEMRKELAEFEEYFQDL
jgi:ketol-acid reductoisomerase